MPITTNDSYLPEGLPIPEASPDGLDTAYYEGLAAGEIRVQFCPACETYQWGPEWACHACHNFEIEWRSVDGRGRIYTWERVWHPVHPALKDACPYLTAIVELPGAQNIRLIGNVIGDPLQAVTVGDAVEAVFERHPDADPPYTLLQWRRLDA